MDRLEQLAAQVGEALKARGQTVAVAESSSGGLVSAALLSVPGASAFFLGGAVVYTPKARAVLMDLPRTALGGVRSASEPYALILARTVRERLAADWGVSETGAAGPTGNGYGDAPGHTCIAVAGALETATTLETGDADRVRNMRAFAIAALDLLSASLDQDQ